MISRFFGAVIGGALAATLFILSGPILILVLLARFIVSPFGSSRMRFSRRRPVFVYTRSYQNTDRFQEPIRTMSEEEYERLRNQRN
ncbi:MAG: hypothetical protein K2P88_13050 [Chitinophagaceae bacterium]|uniref:hypothetical protein n=1 Tax=unclassified Paraflavitalea TaxID=2798305 RepID=UPI003D326007|nr:hypothetical protein [Chitinophagaceae bacterium]